MATGKVTVAALAVCLAAVTLAGCGEDVYDPGAPTFNPFPNWASLASLSAARGGVAAAEVGGVIYVIGGSRGGTVQQTNESYDPAANAWTSRTPMTTGRSYPVAAAVSVVIYVIGGLTDETKDAEVATSANEMYDPGTGLWTTLAADSTTRGLAVAAAVNGIVYVIGGYDYGAKTYAPNVRAYTPAPGGPGTWADKAPLPTPRAAAAVAVVNGLIYVIGGYDGSELATVEVFDPSQGTWNTVASMPTPRHGVTAGVINGQIYVTGGYDLPSQTYYRIVEVYNPATNTWSSGRPMPTRRGWTGSVVLNGYHYVFGGFAGSALNTVEVQLSP